jgi:hypothetical protein
MDGVPQVDGMPRLVREAHRLLSDTDRAALLDFDHAREELAEPLTVPESY